MPVYDIDHIEKAIRKHGVKRLLLALDSDTRLDRRQLLQELEHLAVPVQTVPSMSELVSGRARINDIRDLEIEDLLGRDPVSPDSAVVAASLYEKCVLVTGAGGSIGSELCRQILRQGPAKLVLFDQSEFSCTPSSGSCSPLTASRIWVWRCTRCWAVSCSVAGAPQS